VNLEEPWDALPDDSRQAKAQTEVQIELKRLRGEA
jgi:hypothetical protein